MAQIARQKHFERNTELSEKEVAILHCFAIGLSHADIARYRGLTWLTVKSHLENIYAKLDAANRPHAITLAIQQGLIPA